MAEVPTRFCKLTALLSDPPHRSCHRPPACASPFPLAPPPRLVPPPPRSPSLPPPPARVTNVRVFLINKPPELVYLTLSLESHRLVITIVTV